MSEGSTNIKKINLQILRAKNLFYSDVQKNKSNKWLVIVAGCKKKYMTKPVKCLEGHPYWNCEVEIKLTPGQQESIVLIVADDSNNQYGQVVIPLNQIQPKEESATDSKPVSAVIHCNELEPSKKCSKPTGSLFYRIWASEYFSDEIQKPQVNYKKRHSIFRFKNDPKQSSKNSCVGSSQFNLNHYDSQNVPKRLSLFKSQEKINELNPNRSKAKSLANIYNTKDDDNDHSDSDSQKYHYMFLDKTYNQIKNEFQWVRVEDVVNDKSKYDYDSYSIHEGEQEKVEVLSVQPDHGPITGNFTVVMEGSNFTSGLFDLTYIIIDGLEPIDATSCTSILSDTELLLRMPPISIPGMVNIHLELLDGSRISCTKTFYYIDSTVDTTHCSGLTPQPFDNQDENLSVNCKLFDQYDDMFSSSMNSSKLFKSDAIIVSKNDGTTDCFNNYDYRKLSDYGSQGSFHSDREKMKNTDSSKLQPDDEVESLRKENSDLRTQLNDLESSTSGQILALKCQLKSREYEIDDISRTLCNLKMRLLEDGITKYLELI